MAPNRRAGLVGFFSLPYHARRRDRSIGPQRHHEEPRGNFGDAFSTSLLVTFTTTPTGFPFVASLCFVNHLFCERSVCSLVWRGFTRWTARVFRCEFTRRRSWDAGTRGPPRRSPVAAADFLQQSTAFVRRFGDDLVSHLVFAREKKTQRRSRHVVFAYEKRPSRYDRRSPRNRGFSIARQRHACFEN